MNVKIGARLPTHGELPARLGIARMAQRLEDAGFDSIWTSDHLVAPSTVTSRYPYSEDGRVSWPPATPFYECVIALAAAASVTTTIEFGTAILVLPLREPVLLAKQLATLDAVAGGRVTLGIGAGWMREEFEAVGIDFASRGRIEERSVAILRECWTGTYSPHSLPAGVEVYPLPAHPIPILIGGMTGVSLRRVGRIGDGWVAQQSPNGISPDQIASALEVIERGATESGRPLPAPFRVVLRIGPESHVPEPISSELDELEQAGVTDVIVDADWSSNDGPHKVREVLAAAGAH